MAHLNSSSLQMPFNFFSFAFLLLPSFPIFLFSPNKPNQFLLSLLNSVRPHIYELVSVVGRTAYDGEGPLVLSCSLFFSAFYVNLFHQISITTIIDFLMGSKVRTTETTSHCLKLTINWLRDYDSGRMAFWCNAQYKCWKLDNHLRCLNISSSLVSFHSTKIIYVGVV